MAIKGLSYLAKAKSFDEMVKRLIAGFKKVMNRDPNDEELIKIKIEAGKKVSKIFDKSEAGKKNIKETKTLLKAAGATSAAGVGAAGVSLYNKKKKKD